jgi:hypothetical protein
MATTRAVLIATALALLCGCGGSDVGSVSGTITVGGQPVERGTVVFENPAAGISVTAEIGSGGRYTVKTYEFDGLPPGDYQIAIRPQVLSDGETPLVSDPSAESATPASAIPEKYHRLDQSGLTATVVAGDNPPFDFDLQP